jgi:hypothetical protein
VVLTLAQEGAEPTPDLVYVPPVAEPVKGLRAQCPLYSYSDWQSIKWTAFASPKEEFIRVAGNHDSNAVWAILNKETEENDGFSIAEYNLTTNQWLLDAT